MQKLFSKEEVATLLKVSTRYIELLVAAEAFPKPAYVGDHPIWREKEIGDFIDKSLSPGKTVSAKK
jgi:predicted DNA-binding transcriptional regulator AlpA